MPTTSRFGPRFPTLCALALFFLLTGCQQEETVPEYAVRVGTNYLTVDELNASLQSLAVGLDSVEARKQIIEQWVTRELVAQEAMRQGLQNDEEVLQLVAENERSVLVSALLSRYYIEEGTEPSLSDIEAYYAQHVDQFVLKEDYLRVRYLSTPDEDRANQARDRLRDATAADEADSLWESIVSDYAQDVEGSLRLGANFFPQSRLFPSMALREWTQRLNPGQIAPVIEDGGRYHVLQVADRRAAGTTPEMAWIEDDLRERLIIDARKQMVARQVQRLRNEALAREDLEIR